MSKKATLSVSVSLSVCHELFVANFAILYYMSQLPITVSVIFITDIIIHFNYFINKTFDNFYNIKFMWRSIDLMPTSIAAQLRAGPGF